MPKVVRKTDMCTGHGACPPRANVSWSPDVFANLLNVHRLGDAWEVHCTHPGTQATGSPDVFVNNKAVARVNDVIDCGSSNATGSGNVFANGS